MTIRFHVFLDCAEAYWLVTFFRFFSLLDFLITMAQAEYGVLLLKWTNRNEGLVNFHINFLMWENCSSFHQFFPTNEPETASGLLLDDL